MNRRSRESGFALLLVFVMAAAIAITLYIEVPRIAFESQRTREQMTIDRGLQYKRAIQLFYRKYQTYPQTLDDLETTRNIRFLRHRYLDPLTGKPWRLLHVGPAGQLTDSLVQPPAPLPGSSTGSGPNSSQGSSQTSSSTQAANSSQASNSAQPVDPNNPNAQTFDPLNMAARRPSDRIIGAGGGVGGGTAGGSGGGTSSYAGADQPAAPQPDPNQPPQPVQQPLPGQPVQQSTDPNQPATPAPTPQDPSQPQVPGQPVAGPPAAPQDPSQPPQPPVQFPPGLTPTPGGTPGQTSPQNPTPSPQSPGLQQIPGLQAGLPGQAGASGAGGQPQSAANLIQQILTTPRQPPSSISAFTTGNTGGIAGVASTAEGKGIHVVNDRTKYKEWEFVYDLKKDKTVVGAAAVNQQQQVQGQMQLNQSGTNSPFGSNSTSSSPFSSTPTSSASPAPTTAPPSQ
jgi:type II secretory pathway pseudopilin PulG